MPSSILQPSSVTGISIWPRLTFFSDAGTRHIGGNREGDDGGCLHYCQCNFEGDVYSLRDRSDVCCFVIDISLDVFRRLVDERGKAVSVTPHDYHHDRTEKHKENRFHVLETATCDTLSPAAIWIGLKQSLSNDSSLLAFRAASWNSSPFSRESSSSILTSRSSLVNTTTRGTVMDCRWISRANKCAPGTYCCPKFLACASEIPPHQLPGGGHQHRVLLDITCITCSSKPSASAKRKDLPNRV